MAKTTTGRKIVIDTIPGKKSLSETLGITSDRLTEMKDKMSDLGDEMGVSLGDEIKKASKVAKNDAEFAYLCFFLGHFVASHTCEHGHLNVPKKGKSDHSDGMKDLVSEILSKKS